MEMSMITERLSSVEERTHTHTHTHPRNITDLSWPTVSCVNPFPSDESELGGWERLRKVWRFGGPFLILFSAFNWYTDFGCVLKPSWRSIVNSGGT